MATRTGRSGRTNDHVYKPGSLQDASRWKEGELVTGEVENRFAQGKALVTICEDGTRVTWRDSGGVETYHYHGQKLSDGELKKITG